MKSMVRAKVSYGNGAIELSLPPAGYLGCLERKATIRRPVKALISEAFAKPLEGYSIERACSGKKKILIAVPDATRHAHLGEILPYILKRICRDGRRVDVIVATGLHKPPETRELGELLGYFAVKKCGIYAHSAGKDDVICLGRTRRGITITLDKKAMEYDLIISVGVIEPHLYAGYSGGAKTVAIGLAGEETVNQTHGVRFLDDPSTRIGSVYRNPFQETLWEISGKTPLRFSVNVVNGPDGRAARVFCGRTKDVFRKGVAFARKLYEIEAAAQAGIVICGIGYPKDINLYQASRAINYIVNVERPVLRKGGVMIIAAELRDGAGESAAEKRFHETLRNMRSPRGFVSSVKRDGCIAGVHRAYMVAGPLSGYKIVFVSRDRKGCLKGLPFMHFNRVSEALHYAYKEAGADSGIYVIPRALATIAVVNERR